jgi:hypothetical protein
LALPFGKWLTGNSSDGHIGHSVAIQKLRESKWFDDSEERLFCAVIECGFIVELKNEETGDNWFGVITFDSDLKKGRMVKLTLLKFLVNCGARSVFYFSTIAHYISAVTQFQMTTRSLLNKSN